MWASPPGPTFPSPSADIDAATAYRRFAPAVLGYLRAQRAPDPEDLLGEVFLQAARDIRRFRGSDDDMRRWVLAIARNRLIDAKRRAARRPQLTDAPVPDVAAVPEAAEMDPELVRALDQLTAEQREVLVLRFVADLTLDDVAKVTKRKVGAVKAMQHRALSRLARILGGADGAVEADD